MAGQRVLGIVLAGGAGKRLAPLTADRAKSAVPFGGLYRLVDFALSNLVNAGCGRICVLTQYKSHSLDRHLTTTWRLNGLLGNYVTPVPAQQRLGPHWQAGSADAIYQSLNLIDNDRPDIVAVLGADHVYRMDPLQMIEAHRPGARGHGRGVPVPRMDAVDFGVVQTGRIATTSRRSWKNLPTRRPAPASRMTPSRPWASTCSTAMCWWSAEEGRGRRGSRHAMGGDIMPMLVRERAAHVYDFLQNEVPGAEARDLGYWRDVGTLDSYFDAHMDLCAVHPVFNLYNDRWPILTQVPPPTAGQVRA